jgi:FlaA1/EpsC-like NDP-sugar epimerase
MLSEKDFAMTEEEEKKAAPVQSFYKNKVVLLTGGTGFIGKLLVQKLLRCDFFNSKKCFLKMFKIFQNVAEILDT